MTVSDYSTCPHGKRPGLTTSVCLWCRQEERAAARRRRNQVVARASFAALGTIAVAALAVGAIFALAQRAEQRGPSVQVDTPTPPVQMSAGTVASLHPDSASAPPSAAAAAPLAASSTLTNAPAPASADTASARADSALVPVVAEGRTPLGDSVFAERDGHEVTVRFDNGQLRTRLDRKFEQIVRATLPRVFGQQVAAALDSIPLGKFLRGGSLLTELPSRGIALALPTIGQTMMVYPVTRRGRSGPLVVAYRATITH